MKNGILLLTISCLLFAAPLVFASDYTSASYRVMDPVLMPAGYATSSSYSLSSTIAQISIGTSTSVLWEDRSGFQYFPFANTPVLSGTASDTEAILSWTPSVGVLGWSVSGYDVGQGSSAGGPFAYAALGNILTTTITGLTNGTTYYFVVRARDAFGMPIASSSVISIIPTGAIPPVSPSGGGSGVSYPSTQDGRLVLSGFAYPHAWVTIVVDGILHGTVSSNALSLWSYELTLSAGTHQINIYATDSLARRSAPFTQTLLVPFDTRIVISEIILPPTLEADRESVVQGNTLLLSGSSYPGGDAIIAFGPDPTFETGVSLLRLVSDPFDGHFVYTLSTSDLPAGKYYSRARQAANSALSGPSYPVIFSIGEQSVNTPKPRVCMWGDLNGDLRVNLTDFSIAVYWYTRPLTAQFRAKEASCLNNDGRIDLVDFSLMAYYWTA